MQDLSTKSAYELKTPTLLARRRRNSGPTAATGSKTFEPSSWQIGKGRAGAARSSTQRRGHELRDAHINEIPAETAAKGGAASL